MFYPRSSNDGLADCPLPPPPQSTNQFKFSNFSSTLGTYYYIHSIISQWEKINGFFFFEMKRKNFENVTIFTPRFFAFQVYIIIIITDWPGIKVALLKTFDFFFFFC